MHYSVEWDEPALDQLADIWFHAPDRPSVRKASNQIDRQLRLAPDQQGQQYDGDRLLRVAPLEVVFSASAPAREVRIIAVFYIP
jgi:hypothetical protein